MGLRSPRLWIGLVLGLAAGLAYGWVLRPVELYDTAPGSLRQDYRTDYVLMVAEAYASDGDLPQALVRLAALGPQPPGQYVEQAMAYGTEQGFPAPDLANLSQLARDVQRAPPTAEIRSP
jgi:hypothetical protein